MSTYSARFSLSGGQLAHTQRLSTANGAAALFLDGNMMVEHSEHKRNVMDLSGLWTTDSTDHPNPIDSILKAYKSFAWQPCFDLTLYGNKLTYSMGRDGRKLFAAMSVKYLEVQISTLVSVPKEFGLCGCPSLGVVAAEGLVCFSGMLVVPANVSSFQLPDRVPKEYRWRGSVEFLEFTIFSKTSFHCSCKVYADGRVVVDRRGELSASVVVLEEELISLNAVRYLLDPSRESAVLVTQNNSNVFSLSSDPFEARRVGGSDVNLCLLQGKFLVDLTAVPAEVSGTYKSVVLAQLAVRPAKNYSFLLNSECDGGAIGSRQYVEIELSVDGQIRLFCDHQTRVVTVSLSGNLFRTSHGTACSPLSLYTRCRKSEDCLELVRAMAKAAVVDGVSRICKVPDLDLDSLKNKLIDPRFKIVENGSSCHVPVSRWTRSVFDHTVKQSESKYWSLNGDLIGDLAWSAVSDYGLIPVMEKLKSFVERKNGTVVVEKVPVGRTNVPVVHSTAATSFLELMRFGSKKCVHQLRVMKAADSSEITMLQEVLNWWHQWNTRESQLTHSSLMGYQDIFTDTGKWSIPDDPSVQEQLFQYMAWIYKRGYDTFISEIQTPVFPLIEDLDCESTTLMDNTELIDQMFMLDLRFLKERARALRVIFPEIEKFKCYIYSSSGYNKSKGRWKSSFHLVWPDIIVNGHLAPIIRQTTVEYFIYLSKTDSFFARMAARLVKHYEANIWENVFDQTTSNANNGLRMPYCNKATWVKTDFRQKQSNVENRHCFPIGTVEFEFSEKKFASTREKMHAKERAIEMLNAAASLMCDADNLGSELTASKAAAEDTRIRNQIKQSDKNSIHRTSAFFAAMKIAGGDTRELFDVHAHWSDRVVDAKNLPEPEIAMWIKRGSCRRPHDVQMTPFDNKVVEAFEKADLEFFKGHTLDSLRQTELWSKMTPAAQSGLKKRFNKYVQSGKLLELKNTIAVKQATIESAVQPDTVEPPGSVEPSEQAVVEINDESDFNDPDGPPQIDDLLEDGFDPLFAFDVLDEDSALPFVRKYSKSLEEFYHELSEKLQTLPDMNGYWTHNGMSVTWTSPSPKSIRSGWESVVTIKQGKNLLKNTQVHVAFYFHCGKIVISAINKNNTLYPKICSLVQEISEADDKLYYRIPFPTNVAHEGFPLPDMDACVKQRHAYETQWNSFKRRSSDVAEICI